MSRPNETAATQAFKDQRKTSSYFLDDTESFTDYDTDEIFSIAGLSHDQDSQYLLVEHVEHDIRIPSDIKKSAHDCSNFLENLKKLPNYSGSTNLRTWMVVIQSFLDTQPGLEVIFEPREQQPVYSEIKSVLPYLGMDTVLDSRRFARTLVRQINTVIFNIEALRSTNVNDRNIQQIYNTIKTRENKVLLNGIEGLYAFSLRYYSKTYSISMLQYADTLNSILPAGEAFVEQHLQLSHLMMIASMRKETRDNHIFPTLVDLYKEVLPHRDKHLNYKRQLENDGDLSLEKPCKINFTQDKEGNKRPASNSKQQSKFGNRRGKLNRN